MSGAQPERDAHIESELKRAAGLFNDAEFHAAHEVLDELWDAAAPGDSDFFKGLIQACIALHHYRLGNPDGARKLYSGHRQYLGPYLPAHRGVDVARFLGDMQKSFTPLLRARPGAEPPYASLQLPRLDVASP
jgi:predicted metal-dependent hydrolase